MAIVGVEDIDAAARKPAAWRAPGEVGALMKGSLRTEELMAAALDGNPGLRGDRRTSQVLILGVILHLLTDRGMQPLIRARTGEGAKWLGVVIDSERNTRGETLISATGSRVEVLVIPADEERAVADGAIACLQKKEERSQHGG